MISCVSTEEIIPRRRVPSSPSPSCSKSFLAALVMSSMLAARS